jgi:hypothetical protein
MIRLSRARTVLAAIGAASVLTACATVPATTTPGPTPTGKPCATSADDGLCPAPGHDYGYPADTLSNGRNLYLANNIWNHRALPSATQTMTAYDPGNWSVTANMTAGNTAVISGPEIRQDLNGAPVPLGNYHQVTSSFAENQNPGPGTRSEFGYDIWTSTSAGNLFAQELMIWPDSVNRGTCGGATPVASKVQFGGRNGVPVQAWDLCVNGPKQPGSEYIWYLPASKNERSGSVDILSMLQWMVAHGYYPAGSGVSQIDAGFEICSTGGVPENFRVSRFTLTAN